MNKYGKAALSATKHYSENPLDIVKSWKYAVMEQFPTQEASRKKGCPKTAFLGLCEAGYVKGVPKGKYNKVSNSHNKCYAVKAVKLLQLQDLESIKSKRLWELVMAGVVKSHNAQMDVVLSLWTNGLINKS